MLIHVVRSGESLWKIATHYHVSVGTLSSINGVSDQDLLAVGQSLVIPVSTTQFAELKPAIEVNAYTYQLVNEAVASIQQLGHLLTSVIPFAYHVSEDGTIDSLEDREIIAAAKNKGVIPIMSITNFKGNESGTKVAHALFTRPESRDHLLTNIIHIIQEKGYTGLNIDFENVQPSDREGYNHFLRHTVNLLHSLGYSVSTAVMPKTGFAQPQSAYVAYDYKAHGNIVDFVILMTYEWGYRFGHPQAISPVDKIRQVVSYAVSEIPPSKISLGFETYARDWTIPQAQGQEAETFSPLDAVNRAIQYGAEIKYHQQAQSPYFQYTDEQGRNHEVWFEDARSALAKLNLIQEFELRGVSYWALGFPYPQNWALLENNYAIYKWLIT